MKTNEYGYSTTSPDDPNYYILWTTSISSFVFYAILLTFAIFNVCKYLMRQANTWSLILFYVCCISVCICRLAMFTYTVYLLLLH